MPLDHMGLDLLHHVHPDADDDQERGPPDPDPTDPARPDDDVGQDGDTREEQRPDEQDPIEDPLDIVRGIPSRPDPGAER